MAERKRKISYIKKPFAVKSRISLFLVLGALLLCGVSLGLSVRLEGQGELNVAAWGTSSFLFAVFGLIYGGLSFLEPEKNYLLAKISMGIGGLLVLFWVCMTIVGILS